MMHTEIRKVLVSTRTHEEAGALHTPAARFPLASIGLRCGAFLLDYIFLMLVPAVTVSLALMFKRAAPAMASIILVIGYLATFGLLLVNWVYLCGQTGQTVGRRIIGIRIIRTDGAPMDYRTAMLRHLGGYPLAFICFGLGFWWMLWDGKQQGWHDKLADTLVIKDE
jgi:uncharacterized RDD family membrane protein YckC